jgi:predicted nucleotidyltransferase
VIETSLWHATAVQGLTTILQPDPDVLALAVFGSYLQPEQLDLWSDLDLLLVVKDEAIEHFFPVLDWLKPLGTIYAWEQSSATLRHTARVCFEDLRRIDLVITTESGLEQVWDWSRVPFWRGVQVLFSRSPLVDRVLSETFGPPAWSAASAEQFQTLVNQFWFKGVLAVQKVTRHDLLVALHLALDMARDCCVLGMMLRDRAEGTDYHCERDIGHQFIAEFAGIQQLPTAAGILATIEESSFLFDELAARWSDSYTEHRQPLLAWIRNARKEPD